MKLQEKVNNHAYPDLENAASNKGLQLGFLPSNPEFVILLNGIWVCVTAC